MGDVAVWDERMSKGIETVYNNAINGINAMPAKGTCADCSDDEIKAVVDTAKQLENHARHVGVHAAGVVIATEPLDKPGEEKRASPSTSNTTRHYEAWLAAIYEPPPF